MKNVVDAGRPPWWPEGDPWPPPDRGGGGAKLLRRLLFVGLGLLVVVIVLSMIAGFVFADRGGDRGGPPPFVGIIFLLFIVAVFVFAGRAFRRFSSPLGQVMNGLDQLAAGRYDTRVAPSGPRPVRALGESLNVTAARLEAAEEQRRNLVADIAHEVRTPLSVIRGNAEGMRDGLYATDEARLGAIIDEVDVISRLVEDLNTLSSADAGVLRIHRETTDLGELMREVASSFEAQAVTNGVKIRVTPQPEVVAEVDPQRVRQVLENLLTNSLRHTAAGGEISLELREADTRVEMSVSDTGAGIAPEDLEHIFERYRKGPDSAGSGLGLAIARRLAEAHGGTIRAASVVGQGTTITMSLPKLG